MRSSEIFSHFSKELRKKDEEILNLKVTIAIFIIYSLFIGTYYVKLNEKCISY